MTIQNKLRSLPPGANVHTVILRPLTLFHVHEETSPQAHPGAVTLRWVVRERADADLLAEGLGLFGGPGHIDAVPYVQMDMLGGSLLVPCFRLEMDSTEVKLRESAERASALRKLTPDERRALGIR